MHRLVASVGIFGLIAAGPAPAGAAVRRCHDVIVGQSAMAAVEAEARRMAMSDWIAQARNFGEGFVAWRLAIDRDFSCRRDADATFSCRAAGRPCMIDQVP